MPVVSLSTGIPQHYLDPHPAGTPAVLLLHGLGASGASWELQFPALSAAGLRPLAVDVRGFGRTPNPSRTWSPAQVARDMDALLSALSLESAHVVGISMGGVLAQQFALDYPHRVRRLVLVNTFARLQPDGVSGWLYFLYRFLLVHLISLEQQGRVVAQRIFPHPHQEALRQALREQIRQAEPRTYRAAMRALGRFNALERLAELQMPVLVVTGSEDTTVPPAAQQELTQRIPHAQQVTISGAGHGVIADAPEAFNHALVTFLTAETPSPHNQPSVA